MSSTNKKIVAKTVEVEIDIEIAKDMLEVYGLKTENVSDDEIVKMVLQRMECYGAKSTIK